MRGVPPCLRRPETVRDEYATGLYLVRVQRATQEEIEWSRENYPVSFFLSEPRRAQTDTACYTASRSDPLYGLFVAQSFRGQQQEKAGCCLLSCRRSAVPRSSRLTGTTGRSCRGASTPTENAGYRATNSRRSWCLRPRWCWRTSPSSTCLRVRRIRRWRRRAGRCIRSGRGRTGSWGRGGWILCSRRVGWSIWWIITGCGWSWRGGRARGS